ncbi:MAG: T9SS type A sorting domain-containing protein [Bacteroidota bacterium]
MGSIDSLFYHRIDINVSNNSPDTLKEITFHVPTEFRAAPFKPNYIETTHVSTSIPPGEDQDLSFQMVLPRLDELCLYALGANSRRVGDVDDGSISTDIILSNRNLKTFDGASIYPNPAFNELNINLDQEGVFSYQIYNTLGQPLLFGRTDQQINVSSLMKGHYILSINQDDRFGNFSFIKL